MHYNRRSLILVCFITGDITFDHLVKAGPHILPLKIYPFPFVINILLVLLFILWPSHPRFGFGHILLAHVLFKHVPMFFELYLTFSGYKGAFQAQFGMHFFSAPALKSVISLRRTRALILIYKSISVCICPLNRQD